MDLAVRIEGVSKLYRLGGPPHGRHLREALTAAAAAPWRRFRAWRRGELTPDVTTLWALKDVSFDVRSGEVVGIIGRNGAGKSTLLKVLSRITEPSAGQLELYGRVASLLEVGTGFHPELTGRENIYLNGAILGMSTKEIARKFDEIVAFSEVSAFLDTAVKHYSSGMYMRLAFAVAAHLDPEVLIVDEVLAVGDAAFQAKCLGKMQSVSREGRTVLFVSHNMAAIQGLCRRAIWFERGRVREDGDPSEVVPHYLSATAQGFELGEADATPNSPLRVHCVVLRRDDGQVASSFRPGEPLLVDLHYEAREPVDRPCFWLGVVSQYGSLFAANMLLDGHRPERLEGSGVLTCRFAGLPLLPQLYVLRLGVRARDGLTTLVRTVDAGHFAVSGAARECGFFDELADNHAANSAPVLVPYEWRLPDGRTGAYAPPGGR
jgi:lipopolysaccharide transport system ATP-binding protein